jgi:hypothetical protein
MTSVKSSLSAARYFTAAQRSSQLTQPSSASPGTSTTSSAPSSATAGAISDSSSGSAARQSMMNTNRLPSVITSHSPSRSKPSPFARCSYTAVGSVMPNTARISCASSIEMRSGMIAAILPRTFNFRKCGITRVTIGKSETRRAPRRQETPLSM